MLATAGFQLPVIPLFDVVGKTGAGDPAQIDRLVAKLNTGVMFGLIVCVKVVVTAH